MAWETRGNGRYYYHKRRLGGRVYSEYLGKGATAETLATLFRLEREQHQAERAAEREALEADRAIDRDLDQIGDVVRAVTRAALVSRGYHTHKGQWRKLRKRAWL